jgi:predicted alpha/beta-hydrolase family hydrolase
MPTPFEVPAADAGVTASLHTACLHYEPTHPSGVTFVLAHGAGAGQRHPFMTAMATGLAAHGMDVVTFDFPYMQAGRKIPDKAPVLESCFRAVCEAACARTGPRCLVIGGKSMGGRMATHLGAQGSVPAGRGIVALGYPLHPPGKPTQLRSAHLSSITVPVLIVQGERDAFGGPEELRPVIQAMQAQVTLHVVPGGDHSFASKAVTREATYESIQAAIVGWAAALTWSLKNALVRGEGVSE